MRTKTRWHKSQRPRGPEETAGALAMIGWRIVVERVKSMEAAGFHIDLPQRTLEVISEFLAFLIQLADRLAYVTLDEDNRHRFITALALKFADMVVDNYNDIQSRDHNLFLPNLNKRLRDYADLSFAGEEPGYDMYRYIGDRVLGVLGPEYGRFAAAQVIEVEAPTAAAGFAKAFTAFFEDTASGSFQSRDDDAPRLQ